MNFLAHGLPVLDDAWQLAGTAVPDWLSACDRRCRVRAKRLRPVVAAEADSDEEAARLRRGMLRHLDDDDWFHTSAAFAEAELLIGRRFRRLLGGSDQARPGFLGHIAAEMILDGVLMRRTPGLVDRYYRQLQLVPAEEIERIVCEVATRPTEKLAVFIGKFHHYEYLRGYPDPPSMVARLNGVLRRVKLPPLPVEAVAVVEAGFAIVAERADAMLSGPGRDGPAAG